MIQRKSSWADLLPRTCLSYAKSRIRATIRGEAKCCAESLETGRRSAIPLASQETSICRFYKKEGNQECTDVLALPERRSQPQRQYLHELIAGMGKLMKLSMSSKYLLGKYTKKDSKRSQGGCLGCLIASSCSQTPTHYSDWSTRARFKIRHSKSEKLWLPKLCASLSSGAPREQPSQRAIHSNYLAT
eukprot:1616168-Amphidinium_carterae.1